MIPVFKAVHSDMSAQANRSFIYPTSGIVKDRDGHGLHGLPYGIGNDSWWVNIRPAKYLVIKAYNVRLMTSLGKCSFKHGYVVGCYDYVDEAALHMATLTTWWKAIDATAHIETITHEHWKALIYLAKEAADVIQKRTDALAEGARTREQRWRDTVTTGVFVPNWPVSVGSGETKVAPPTQNDTAPERAKVLVPRTRSGAGEPR